MKGVKLKVLYAAVVVLAVFLLWQIFSVDKVYGFLEDQSMHQSVVSRGTTNPGVTILAFIDYATIPSQEMDPIVRQAMEDVGNVRIIFHPVPQDSEMVRKAARVVLAAAQIKRDQPGGYNIVHDVMIRNQRPLTDAVIRDLARQMGIDGEALIAESESPAIYERLMITVAAAQRLKVRATPYYILNRKGAYLPEGRFPTVAEFSNLIQSVRP